MGGLAAKIKKYGIKKSVNVFFRYKLEPVLGWIFGRLFHLFPMKNAIIFSSHNDFDMNSGALYEYILKRQGNKKYKLVWFVEREQIVKLPRNVMQISVHGINLRRYYWQAVAKYIFYDDTVIKKYRKNQIAVYLGHATRAMKNCRGKVPVPTDIDYVCSSSEENDPLMSEVYGCDINKMIHTGFPVTDLLYRHWKEFGKLKLEHTYKKIIIWMPTFRQSSFDVLRNDSNSNSETGLSLIESMVQFKDMDRYLEKNDTLMIVKFHPAQDMKAIHIYDTNNVMLLSPERIKKLGVDTYKLLTNTDALISDYSSISFDYLLLNRPIAYVLSDYESYKLGFIVSNPWDYMPGEYLYSYEDLTTFLNHVMCGEDSMENKRRIVREKVARYNDGNASERIVEFLKIL